MPTTIKRFTFNQLFSNQHGLESEKILQQGIHLLSFFSFVINLFTNLRSGQVSPTS